MRDSTKFDVTVSFEDEKPIRLTVYSPGFNGAALSAAKNAFDGLRPAKRLVGPSLSALVLMRSEQKSAIFRVELTNTSVMPLESAGIPLEEWFIDTASERSVLAKIRASLVHVKALPRDEKSAIAFVDSTTADQRRIIAECLAEKFGLVVHNLDKTTIQLSQDEIALLLEALDSHEYWQLSDEHYRASGYVQEPGTDDPEKLEALKATRALVERLETLKR